MPVDKTTDETEALRYNAFQLAANYPPPHGYKDVEEIVAAAEKIIAFIKGTTKETTNERT